MAKVNFTAARVNGHSCPAGKGQSFLWDSGASGLGLRATAAGARTYVWQGKLHGATVRCSIGSPKDWGIDDARDEARRLQRLIDAGKDPRQDAIEQRVAHEAQRVESRRRDMTVDEAWKVYLADRKPYWSERHYRDHVTLSAAGGQPVKRGKGVTMPGPLSHLMPLRLFELTGERIAQWLQSQTTERPTMAALSFRLLRAFIRWTADTPEYSGLAQDDAYKARRVKNAVPKVSAAIGDVLQREQLPAWFAAIRQIDSPVISTYLQALLITGARREEMAALRWDDVDLRWRSLSISDKVEEAGRVIPLPPYLASLLLELKRINETPPSMRRLAHMKERGKTWEPSPWVFFSKTSADGKLAEPRIAHLKALAIAGLPHLTIQGLRKSCASLSEWCEVPAGVMAQIQGHKPSALREKHYVRRPLDLLRMWHDRVEAWLLQQAGIEFKLPHPSGLREVTAA